MASNELVTHVTPTVITKVPIARRDFVCRLRAAWSSVRRVPPDRADTVLRRPARIARSRDETWVVPRRD